MLELFGTVASRARRALWTLEEVGAEYTFHKLNFRERDHLKPEYLAMNPNGRVPTLRDGDVVLFESAAICDYIARKFPGAGLIPELGTTDYALYLQWMFWVATELEQGLWSMGKHRFALPREYRIDEMQRVARFEWDRAAPVLARALEGKTFLVGDRMTVADIMAGHTLSWARAFKVPFGHQILEDYLGRLLARPAYLKTTELE